MWGNTDWHRRLQDAAYSPSIRRRKAVFARDLVFHAAGTKAIFRKHPLERYFRDIHVAVQHAAGFPSHYESAGRVFLGLHPSGHGW
jgi:indole-3-acetate monooxygenase